MVAQLDQFLVDVTRGELASRFACDAASVIADANLPEELKQAVEGKDIAFLFKAGGHPMALLYFARSLGISNDQYYDLISGL